MILAQVLGTVVSTRKDARALEPQAAARARGRRPVPAGRATTSSPPTRSGAGRGRARADRAGLLGAHDRGVAREAGRRRDLRHRRRGRDGRPATSTSKRAARRTAPGDRAADATRRHGDRRERLSAIVAEVLERLEAGRARRAGARASAPLGVHADLDTAVTARARARSRRYDRVPLVDAQRASSPRSARRWPSSTDALVASSRSRRPGSGGSRTRSSRTGSSPSSTPGTEDLEPIAWTGDHGLTLLERAPYGVDRRDHAGHEPERDHHQQRHLDDRRRQHRACCARIPTRARSRTSTIDLMNRAARRAGAPLPLLHSVEQPTLEVAQALLRYARHPAQRRDRRPGRGAGGARRRQEGDHRRARQPAVGGRRDRRPRQAPRATSIAGASLDNNIICTDEKEVIAVAMIADRLKESFARAGAIVLAPHQTERLRELVLEKERGPRKHAVINRKFVGKNVDVILREAGIPCDAVEAPGGVRGGRRPSVPVDRDDDADPAAGARARPWTRRSTSRSRSSTASATPRRCTRATSTSCRRWRGRATARSSSRTAPTSPGWATGGEGPTSFTIASPTGEGMTTARSFTRHPALHAGRPRSGSCDARRHRRDRDAAASPRARVVGDAMVKTAEVDAARRRCPISPGKYWVLIGGDVAPVRASLRARARGRGRHAARLAVHPAAPRHGAAGARAARSPAVDARRARRDRDADRRGGDRGRRPRPPRRPTVTLRDLRLANGLGGKGVVFLTGDVSNVQAAVEAGRAEALQQGPARPLGRGAAAPPADEGAGCSDALRARRRARWCAPRRCRRGAGTGCCCIEPTDRRGRGQPAARSWPSTWSRPRPASACSTCAGARRRTRCPIPTIPADAAIVGIVDDVREVPLAAPPAQAALMILGACRGRGGRDDQASRAVGAEAAAGAAGDAADTAERASVAIAVDAVQAGVGDHVLVADEGNSAAQVLRRGRGAIRTVIVGVVDEVGRAVASEGLGCSRRRPC